MSDVIDDLKIQIDASTQNADAKLDKFIANMMRLQSTVAGLEMSNIGSITNVINQMSAAFEKLGSISVKQSMTGIEKQINQSSKRIAEDLASMFGVEDKRALDDLKQLSKEFAQLMKTGNDGKALDNNMAGFVSVIESGITKTKVFDDEMRRFYETVKSVSKIKISPQDKAGLGDDWKYMDGLLRQKMSTVDGIGLDSLMVEWKDKFKGLFGSEVDKAFNLDTVEGQFQALNSIIKQCRDGLVITDPNSITNDAIWEQVVDRVGKVYSEINRLKQDSVKMVDTQNSGFDVTGLEAIIKSVSRLGSESNKRGVENVALLGNSLTSLITQLNSVGSIKFDPDSISGLANAVAKLGHVTISEATQNLEFLKNSLAEFINGMNNAGNLSFDTGGLITLVNSVSRLGGANATQSVQNLPLISTALKNFITDMNSVGSVTFDFTGLNSLVGNITKLGGVKATQAATNLTPIKDEFLRFVEGLNGIGLLNFDTSGLTNLVSSITKLGGKAATAAIPNIQALGTALRQLMTTLSGAPAVSQNLIQMTNALANLASHGTRVAGASTAMQRGLNSYSNSANRATKSTKGLVSQIGMFYAKCFLMIRGVKALWKATKSSMDYIETLNYFDAAWRQVSDNATKEWEKAGYKSAEAYAASFSERAKVLTGKMSGFQPDVNGNLISTGMPSLGLDPEKLMNYQATFGQMASSMGVTSETSLKLSQALTEIGADLASVKNLEFEKVWQDMASGMVGMSRTLDKYGVNIRNVNLQEKLSELGIKAKVSALNQQDKALLRTIILLDSTKYAWGDLANTIDQPANSLRLMQANFANLARTIGNLFLPIVSQVLPYINALVIALQRLFAWLGGLLGIKIGELGSSIGSAAVDMGDLADDAEDVAGATGDAAKNSKKMADNLQKFDNLNVISTKKASGSGGSGGAGAGGLLDDAFNDAFSEYQAAWDAAFANLENSAQKMADKICDAFKRGDYFGIGTYISNGITGALESINWDSVYSVAANFGKGFADFLNGLFTPDMFGSVGMTIAGVLNTLLYTALSFGKNFDWINLGNSIASGLNNFFSTFDFASAGEAIHVFAKGLLDTLIVAIDNIDWSLIGTQIGTLLANMNLSDLSGKVGELIWKAINAGVELWKGSFKAAPIETAIITAIGLLKFTGIGKVIGAKIISSIAKDASFAGIGKLLIKLFPSSTIISTITTTMAQTGASLPSVLSGLILVPIKTFFTTTIPGAIMGALSGLGSAIMTGIAGLASALGISIAAAGALVVAAVAAAVVGIVYTVTHWDEIKEFWTVKVPAWWNGTAMPFFKEIPEQLSKVWEKVKSTAAQKWDSFLTYLRGVPGKVGELITSIWEWFDELPGKIGYALGYALGTVTAWAIELKDYLFQKIPEIIENIFTWFKELPGKIESAIFGTIEKVASWGSEVYKAFKNKVDEIIENVVTWFSELPEKIYGKIITISEKISKWATNTIEFFRIEIPKIVDKVVGFFEELPKKIKEVGENLIKGLWEGIFNLTDWLGTKISDFCRGVIDGFKKGFDEHSPSKESFQIGDYWTVGLINGIVNKFGVLKKKIDTFTQGLADKTIELPLIETELSINREVLDTLDASVNISYKDSNFDLESSVSAELKSAIENMIDYDRLGKTLAKELEAANITANLDSDKAYGNVKSKWTQEYNRIKRPPVPV